MNGLWTLPYDIAVAGFWRLGSGEYTTVSSGVRPTGIGNRIRADYSLISRNEFALDPFHSLDFRVTKEFPLPNGMRLSGIFEVFNIYNYAGYNYNTLETSSQFGGANSSATDSRSLQLAFRVQF